MRVAPVIELTKEERAELTRLADATLVNPRLAKRARIVLLAAHGMQNKDIAEELTVGRVQVSRWRERYLQSRISGIEQDLPRGAPAAKVDVARLVHMTTLSSPDAGPRWSTRKMAVAMGISPASVSRHWRANALKPQSPGSVDLQRNAGPSENLETIAGIYRSQSIRAIALYIPQAGSALPAALPVRDPARVNTALFAALQALDNQDFSVDPAPSPQVPWLKFLRRIGHEIPSDHSLHVLIVDHVTHSHPSVLKWLARHRRIHIHTVHSAEEWLASLELLLGDIDLQRLQGQANASIPLLVTAIAAQLEDALAFREPFVWTSGAHTVRTAVSGVDTPVPTENDIARSKVKARLMSRHLGNGDTLRDNVISLKRDRILQEAAMLFFERGYLQTSVDTIAERLGATKPFVYYHFHSKVDILVEICEKSNRDVLAAAESAMSAQGSPRARFEQFLREFTNVALQQHQHVAIYFREEVSLPKEASDRIKQMRKSINMRLTALLIEGIKAGDFQIEDPRMAALVISGMSSYAFAWYRENGRLDQQEVTNRIVEMALKLVSASPFRRPAYRVQSLARL